MQIRFADTFWPSLKKLFRPWWHPRELLYSLECWWRGYSTVKPRTLSFRDADTCELLAHVMFEVLGRFIEQEADRHHVEWYGEYGPTLVVDGVIEYARDEMNYLWDWWNNVYLSAYPAAVDARWDEIDRLFGKDGESATSYKERMRKIDAIGKLEDEQQHELAARLHRLVNLRPYLWT